MAKIPVSKLAVCSWSMRPANSLQLMEQLEAVGIGRVQIALGPLRNTPGNWDELPELCRQNRVELISGMMVTVGEDYSTPETIRRTGGVTPEATWEENWRNMQADAEIADGLGLKLVTFHAGFLPHDPADAQYGKLLDRLARIADLFAAFDISLGLETGQETAADLETFLKALNRRNVGVNFDPANMILYEKGDPIEALRRLGPWLRQCHIKDALPTEKPGTWGREMVAGQGAVDWRGFFKTLEEMDFSGDLAIEREAGNQRVEDIRAARVYIESLAGL